MTPLDEFQAAWSAVPELPPLFTVSNLNVDLDGMPDLWAGVVVMVEGTGHITMGSEPWREESGSFLVGVFTRAGEGSALGDAAARAITAAFLDWQSPDRAMTIPTIIGPLDIEPEADGGWYRLAMELQYRQWSKGTAPGELRPMAHKALPQGAAA